MATAKTLVGWLALLFHALFCLLLVALALFAFVTNPQSLHLEMFSWKGATLAYIILGGGLFGLLSITLALADRLRFPFLLWTLLTAIVLTKSLIFSSYRLPPGDWQRAVYLVLTTWFAVLGAVFILGAQPSRGPRKYRVK